MVRRQTAQKVVLTLLDVVFINVAFALSYIIRYRLNMPYPVEERYDAPFTPYIPFAILLTVLSLTMFRLSGLYEERRRRRWLNEIYSLVSGTATSIVIVMAITFFLQPLVYSRGMLVLAGVLIVVSLSIVRLIWSVILASHYRRGVGVQRLLIVGAGEIGRAVMRTILATPMLGYQIIGYVDDDPAKDDGLGRIRSLGKLDQLSEVIVKEKIDEVIVTLPWMYHRRIMQIVEDCEREHIQVKVVPDVFEQRMRNVDLDTLSGIPLLGPGPERLGSSAVLIKRAVDLVLSIIALPFFALLYVVAGIAIKLDSPGPILFKQQRIGKDGKPFEVVKFRTMIVGAEQMKDAVTHLNKFKDNILLKVPDDPRMTRVGRFLRRTSIDELPQIINVLRGEMSWIGPRPNTPDEVAQYAPWQRKRLSVLPGITGLWQVSGRSDVPFDEMCLLDIFYIENWSLELDFRIMLQTIPHLIVGNGAY